MHVLVIGSGYVGLVAAVGFAEAGHQVLGIDVDVAKINKLKQGISPIYEPGLEEWLARHQASGQLSFGQVCSGLLHIHLIRKINLRA